MSVDYIKENTLRCEAGFRGGGIEISLDKLLHLEGYKMTAYQNYLGGGILGSIQNSYNFRLDDLNDAMLVEVDKIRDELNRYFHSLTNHEGDEYEETTYEECQLRPESAY